MKEKKQIHTGLCITDDRIVATTAHIENKTMIITDAMEMKRSSTIDEDIAEFINTYDLEEGEYSIVACIPTEMTMASFDPHDFDVKEFSGEIDQVIDISVKYSVNGEGLNSLVKQVKNYLKLVGDEKKTTRIYITDRYAYYKPIRVYEIKNGVTKIKYIRENVQYTDSSLTDLFLDLVKVSKGESNFNNTEGEYYE